MNVIRKLLKLVLYFVLAFVMCSITGVVTLRFVNPPTSAVIFAWQLSSGERARFQWRALDQISPHLQIAVITSEDQKFPHHMGFDIASIKQALGSGNGRPRGASTITQQVAKNLFLWNGRSYLRKVIEAWFTLLIEMVWPKQRILEIYLNIAEFGEGVYGAEAAARTFYGQSAQELTPWQSAVLAAVLPNPKVMSATTPSAYVQSRAATIVAMSRQLGGTRYLQQLTQQ